MSDFQHKLASATSPADMPKPSTITEAKQVIIRTIELDIRCGDPLDYPDDDLTRCAEVYLRMTYN